MKQIYRVMEVCLHHDGVEVLLMHTQTGHKRLIDLHEYSILDWGTLDKSKLKKLLKSSIERSYTDKSDMASVEF